jgi:hypothetical protein
MSAQEFQAIIEAIGISDRNEDSNISERELNQYLRRLKGLHPDRQSSYIDEEALREAFSKGSQSPSALLEITSSYLSSKSEQKEATLLPV